MKFASSALMNASSPISVSQSCISRSTAANSPSFTRPSLSTRSEACLTVAAFAKDGWFSTMSNFVSTTATGTLSSLSVRMSQALRRYRAISFTMFMGFLASLSSPPSEAMRSSSETNSLTFGSISGSRVSMIAFEALMLRQTGSEGERCCS